VTAPPRVETETVTSSGGDIKSIETRDPADDMHEENFADALGEKPVALLMATPALCQTRVCGPVTDIAAQFQKEYGDRVTFIHQEVYEDNDVQKGLRAPLRGIRAANRAVAVHLHRRRARGGAARGVVRKPGVQARGRGRAGRWSMTNAHAHRHGRRVHSHTYVGPHRHALRPRRSEAVGDTGHNHAGPAHSHGLIDTSIKRSREGVRAVLVALVMLGAIAALQALVFVASGSVALLADLVHNAGDAATAVPLGRLFPYVARGRRPLRYDDRSTRRIASRRLQAPQRRPAGSRTRRFSRAAGRACLSGSSCKWWRQFRRRPG
jgi:hypothetical protein